MNEPTTESIEAKLEEIAGRLNAATEGPYEWSWHPHRHDGVIALEVAASPIDVLLCTENGEHVFGEIKQADADLLAHSWTDIGYLLTLCRKRGKEIEILEACNDALGHPVASPCGHSSIYAVSDDGGANIRCLMCRESRLESELARLKEENGRWKAAIEGLTPNGSEYVDDPEACAAAIRHRTRWPQQIIEARAELSRLRKENAEVALTELREIWSDNEFTFDFAFRPDGWRQVSIFRFAPSQFRDTIVVAQAPTLSEAMQKVREFAAQQKGDSKEDSKTIDKCK